MLVIRKIGDIRLSEACIFCECLDRFLLVQLQQESGAKEDLVSEVFFTPGIFARQRYFPSGHETEQFKNINLYFDNIIVGFFCL